jgi:hypothetical protein
MKGTYSMGFERPLYVVHLDEDDVAEAKRLIQNALSATEPEVSE